MPNYAEVAVDAPVNPARTPSRTFSYRIPDRFRIRPGQLVWVPFGRRTLQGMVMALADTPQVAETRDILQPVEPAPLLDANALALAQWLSRYYFCPLFDALSLFLPPGFKAQVRSQIRPAAALDAAANAAAVERLKEATRDALQTLAERKRLSETEFSKLLGRAALREVNRLVEQGLIQRAVSLPQPRNFRYASRLFPARPPDDSDSDSDTGTPSVKLSSRQAGLLQAVREQSGGYSTTQANKEFGPTAGKALVEKGLLGLEWVRQESPPTVPPPLPAEWADYPLPPAATPTKREITLTPAQADALGRIVETLDNPGRQPRVFLLHGVTGSGKTEVYLRAIRHIVDRGQQAIFLVPEIALTPQTVQRINARFPGRVALLHSSLTDRQKFDQWWKIRDGDYSVVVGPRSALFAPVPDLGLVVIDEEHEWTYKQEETPPFYHARTAALELPRLTGAAVILGSATPDIETYHHAQNGRYRLLVLPRRIRPPTPTTPPPQIKDEPAAYLLDRVDIATPPRLELAPPAIDGLFHPPPAADWLTVDATDPSLDAVADDGLADVEVCDMRLELRQGNRSIFSRALAAALRESIAQGRQAILFLNRRGSAPIVQCRDCGYVVSCRSCAVALTYHAAESRLRCHRCNRRSRPPTRCRHCGGSHIRQLGIGTQRVVEETQNLLPGALVERWDADAARSGPGPNETMRRLASGETQVLVGTQLVAKGLDVPNVTLVGVVLADVGLHRPDFRAGERAFGLLCQVAGRAGRGAEPGRVIIQTYNPDHYAVAAAARQDYAALYATEIAARHQQGNPPFNRLAHLLYRHFDPTACQQQAATAARMLRQRVRAQGLADLQVIGPAPGLPEKVRGHYRWHIILRGRRLHAFLQDVELPLRDAAIDIDPVHLL